jgi:hypothetical protein
VKFAETLLTYQGKPLDLYPFQREFLRSVDWLHDRVAVQKGRAIGASFMCSIAIVYAAFIHNDARIAIISKTKEQSGYIFEHVCRFFRASPILADYVNEQRSKTDELILSNGSVVVHRTAGHRGDNLRGFHCQGRGALFLDESSSIPSIAIENLYPAAVGCGIFHVSTPKQPAGEFYRVCTRDPDFRVLKLPSTISPRITPQDLALWKRIFSPSRYRNEVLGEFAAGEDCVFDADSIDRAIDDTLPLFDPHSGFTNFDLEANYVYSLDISRIGADRWALTIGEVDSLDNSLRVVAYQSWMGSRHEKDSPNAVLTDNPDDIIRDILGLAHCFYPLRIYADATSNEYFCHTLAHRHNLPVEEVVWSTTKKQRMIEHLASCLRAGKVKIPRDDEIIEQLIDYAYDLKRMEDDSDRKIYLAGDDDYVSSLAQLAQAISWETDSEFVEYLELI